MRSWLTIKGNSAAQLAKAPVIGADTLVVDMSLVPDDENAAQVRADVAEWFSSFREQLSTPKSFKRWLRIKPLDGTHWIDDLSVIMAGAPDGLIVPKCTGPEQVRMLASELYEIEQRHGVGHNATKIIPQIGETPGSALTLRDYTDDPHPRLAGFAWNAEGLAREIGAQRTRTDDGRWCDTMRLVRGTTILLAKTLGLLAIETSVRDPKDLQTGALAARRARQDGFTGMAANHPRQVALINDAFKPTANERAEAQAIVDLFASTPSVAMVNHKGTMVDRTGLEQAEQLLELV
ncbi:CoA ester lyase [Pontixanthobacter sp. CEM42]|uniref:HpcH/HpaI aldolase/citrate lyase family protein n=1 Tax=Pontixanthobacter sp. CEM42 TaxID=2792077 RepID=UPI001AE07F08|nr:CoA ester lyase [Pontixanthobacter sp. CEM42]